MFCAANVSLAAGSRCYAAATRMRVTFLKIGCVATFAWLLSAPIEAQGPPPSAARAPQAEFDQYTTQFAADWIKANPQAATSQQYFEGAEQDALDRELTATDGQNGMPLDPQGIAAYKARANEGLEHLKRF